MRTKLVDKHGYNWQVVKRSRRTAMIVLQKPAQTGCKYYRTRQIAVLPLPTSRFLERHVIFALMRPFQVVPCNVLGAEVSKMFFAEAYEVIETFLLDALAPPSA